MNSKQLKRKYEDLLFWGDVIVMKESAAEFRTYLKIRGITWTEKPAENDYQIIFERGPLNK